MKGKRIPWVLLLPLLLLAPVVLAQTGGDFDLSWGTVDGGSTATLLGGTFELGGTVGQPDAATLSGDDFILEGGFWTADLQPTAVELVRFEAYPAGSSIRLEWETASEIDNLGFHLHRSDAPQGDYLRLNEVLIPSQAPGSPLGATYAWLDQDVQPGVVYFYKLEAVDLYGQSTEYGPVQGYLPAVWYHYYLPGVHKGW